MSAHDDDRGGVPSASSVERVAYCPSSFNFEKHFPDRPSDIAKEGELMHDVIMDFKDMSVLTEKQQDDVAKGLRQRTEVIKDTIGTIDVRRREERIWLSHKGDHVLSSRYDELLVNEKGEALLIDYKFGYKEVTHSSNNMQLRAQAVLTYQQYGYSVIYASIVSPRTSEPTIVKFEKDDLIEAKNFIVNASLMAMETDDLENLNAGRWCDYCKARHICPKAWEVAYSPEELIIEWSGQQSL